MDYSDSGLYTQTQVETAQARVTAGRADTTIVVEERTSVWDRVPYPWITFDMALRLDDINRREDAIDAILRWPNASLALVLDAQEEGRRCSEDAKAWIEDVEKALGMWTAWP